MRDAQREKLKEEAVDKVELSLSSSSTKQASSSSTKQVCASFYKKDAQHTQNNIQKQLVGKKLKGLVMNFHAGI